MFGLKDMCGRECVNALLGKWWNLDFQYLVSRILYWTLYEVILVLDLIWTYIWMCVRPYMDLYIECVVCRVFDCMWIDLGL